MGMGAQLSGTVHNLLVSRKIIDGKKINVLPKKKPIAKEGGEAPVASAAPVAEVATPVAEAATPEATPAPEPVVEAPAPEAPAETPTA